MKACILLLLLAFITVSLKAQSPAPGGAAQQCIVEFTFPSSGNCIGQGVQFTDLSSVGGLGYIITWEWDFGDGSPILVVNFPYSPNVVHTFPGFSNYYTVTLTITGSLGCTNSKSRVVTLTPAPVANFSYPSTGRCIGLPVQFTDLSQTNGGGSIQVWNWNFGDGTMFVSNQNPVHIYAVPATYNVTQIVTNSNGCSDTIVKAVAIDPLPVPTLSGPASACAGTAGHLYSTQPGMTGYVWNVSPGGTVTAGGGSGNNTATVSWNLAGAQSVSVNYTGINGCAATSPVVYNVMVNPAPAATITASGPTTICAGNSVTLTAGLANAYLWSTGATTQSITVSVSGNYTVTVTNGNGCTAASQPTLVTVLPNPVAGAGPDQSIGYGASTTLNGSASGGSGYYSWHWEPASLLVNPNLQHPVTVNLSASAQFTLTVSDIANGCTGNDQVLVMVTGGPLSVDATATPGIACPGDAVQLMAIASGGTGNNTFLWTSNPAGFTSLIYNPVVYPVVSATFIVTVDDGFASMTDSVSVSVLPLPGIPGTPAGPDTADLHTIVSSTYTTTGGSAASSYLWELSPEIAGTISGTGTSGMLSWNPAYQGKALIRVKSMNSCGESDWTAEKMTEVINTTTGIAAGKDPRFPAIYPNPTTGLVYISLARSSTISLFTLTGTLVKVAGDFTAGYLNLSGYSRGVYFLRVEAPGYPAIQRKIVLL